MQRPLATVVIGGLISATFLTLVVLPAVYPAVTGMRFPFRRGGSGSGDARPRETARMREDADA